MLIATQLFQICDSARRQVLTLIPGWAFFFFLMYSVGDDAEIKGFDPFAILGVTPSTETREIKKQYRALSLIYHPDKVSLTIAKCCEVVPFRVSSGSGRLNWSGRREA